MTEQTPTPTTDNSPATTNTPADTNGVAPAAATTADQPPAPAAPAADNPGANQPAADDKISDNILAPAEGENGQTETDAPKPGDQESESKQPDSEKEKGQSEDGEPLAAEAYREALKLPEGMEIDQTAFDATVPILQKYNLPAEAINELGEVAAGIVSRQVKEQAEAHQQVVQSWHDKTIELHGKEGEEKFAEKAAVAQKAINKFFDADAKKLLQDFGFGNHPALFAMAYQVGMAIEEDGSGLPPAGDGQPQGEETLAGVWYPDQNKTT